MTEFANESSAASKLIEVNSGQGIDNLNRSPYCSVLDTVYFIAESSELSRLCPIKETLISPF